MAVPARAQAPSRAESGDRALLGALAGFAIALLGQGLWWADAEPHLGLLLFILGGACVGLRLPPIDVPRPASVAAALHAWRWAPIAALALAAALVGSADVVLRLPALAWGYLAALIALAVAGWALDRSARSAPRLRRPTTETIALLGVVIVALFLRVWQWDSVPPGLPGDEPWAVINARDILEIPSPTSLFDVPQWRHPNVHHFLAAGLLLLGTDPRLALVLMGAIPGTISVALLYLVVREAHGGAVALVAAAFLALERFYVLLTRKGDDDGLAVALTLAALWFTLRGLRSGRMGWFVGVGIACGVNLIYLYVGSLAPLFVALLWLLVRRDGDLGRRDGFLALCLSAFVALCVFLPRAVAAYVSPLSIAYSAEHLAPWANEGDAAAFFWRQLQQALVAFGYRSGGGSWHIFDDLGGALFDPVSAALSTMGVGYFAVRIREPWPRFWLVTGALGIAASAFSEGPGAYNWRLIMALPSLMVGAALVLVIASRRLAGAARWPPLAWAPVGLALFAVGASTYRDYFVGFRERESVWLDGTAQSLHAARWLRAHADLLPSTLVVAARDVGTTAPFLLLRPAELDRRTPFQMLDNADEVPFAYDLPPGVERVWLVTSAEPWDSWYVASPVRGARELVGLYYPEARQTLVRDPVDDRPLFYVQEIDRADFERHRHLVRDGAVACGGAAPRQGWRGLLFVPAAARYRLAAAGASCAAFDLRGTNAREQPSYLSRGWHELVLWAPEGREPSVQLLSNEQPIPVPVAHLYAGSRVPIGFEATIAAAPGAPPLERRYLPVFDTDWTPNPPTEGGSYVTLRGRLRVEAGGRIGLHFLLPYTSRVALDGTPVAMSGAEGEVVGSQEVAAGEHLLEVSYQAPAPTLGRYAPPDGPERNLDLRVVSPP